MGQPRGSGKINVRLWLCLAFASFATVSCSLTTPELIVQDLPALELDADSLTFKGRNLYSTTIPLKGKVSPLVESIQLSFDNGATWVNPNSTSIASFAKTHAPASEANTPFKITVTQIGNLNSAFANTQFGTYATVLVRGTGSFGNTQAASFKVLRTNYQSYGVFGVAQRGGINKTLTGGHLKIRGGQIVNNKKNVVVVGQLRARGGLQ